MKLFILLVFLATSLAKNVSLNVPLTSNSTIRPIDGVWQSFSIEYSYMADYFGNKSQPNTFSNNILQSLKDRSGKNVILRVGGSTANRVAYNASQEEAVINVFGSNPDQPSHVYIGPVWYEAFQTAPEGTLVIYDVNYRDNTSAGVNATIEDARRVWDQLDNLYAFELGNEVEGWGKNGRTSDWSPELYVPDFLKYTSLLDFVDKPFFQGGVLQGSGGAYINEPWNSVRLLELELNRDGDIKAMSQHDYHGNNCDTTDEIPEVRQNLLNHTNVINRVWPHKQMSSVVAAQNVEYVLGETNSISCQGRDNVSNVFASALWYLDYNLYVAAHTEVAKMYFHQGTPYRYSIWAPDEARPIYYGALLLAKALDGEKQVLSVAEEETFVAYSLYSKNELDSVIVVNLEPYNATGNATTGRRFVDVQLPAAAKKLWRLTAPGADVKTGIRWAGQAVQEDGTIGEEITEEVGQVVRVQDSEAVLVKW
ncbi:glycoside hydrolase family 79 protein [Aplosporella prunicola CBS 121167]|uniref:Glycoside hydrolase family 79 protein n=1 Tax=Aplosporella prunicola CBS 121167 TaxID=1176127 RepID=A0A6A6BT23_9PEZI|nr:glycoside hydrolase family 79 protein [Aplosporella prunicola CBS 121167]KAF2146415.1 glycoside hydrolase family 79 protein [Aplosporella prunicola CBS 121167]